MARHDENTESPRLELLGARRRDVAVALKRSGAMSVDALASALGQSKTAMRSHLVRMEEQGLLRRARVDSPTRGRPPLTYELTDEGHALFPGHERALLTRLLGFIKEQGQVELIHTFLERLWAERIDEFERELAAHPDSDTLDARLATLERVLARADFMPEIHRDGAHVEVRACNCPFEGVVDATKAPCRLEKKLLERALEMRVSKTRFVFQGEPVCTFSLTPDDE